MRKILFIFILFSCNSKSDEFDLGRIDKLEVTDYSTGIVDSEINKKIIREFKKVLQGTSEQIQCKSSGSIAFLDGDDLKLKVDFSIEPPDCVFLILKKDSKNIAYRLNYQSGMYLGEHLYQLKRK